PNNVINSLYEMKLSDRSLLWIGTDKGLVWLDIDSKGATFSTLPKNTNSLMLDKLEIAYICQDQYQRVYLFTSEGIMRLTPRGLTPDAGYEVYLFTTEDGLPGYGINRNAGMVDMYGCLWAGTPNGAAMFDPAIVAKDTQPKPLRIERTLLNGKDFI